MTGNCGGNPGAFRARIRVRGIVQGVGFRPFVYRTASALGLGGFVRNDSSGVLIEAEGPKERVEGLLDSIRRGGPPAARVEGIGISEVPAAGETAFRIEESDAGAPPATLISPDLAMCSDCRRELLDGSDRRFGYPFINCTFCGPRYTIVRKVPYDRPNTTMSGFRMCPACEREYHDPSDRRFHAQPTACPACGPHLRIVPSPARRGGGVPDGPLPISPGPGSGATCGAGMRPGRSLALQGHASDVQVPEVWNGTAPRGVSGTFSGDAVALEAAASALAGGRILAIKGLGGFHLACDARNDWAVLELRRRKRREEKPLAVMCADISEARRVAEISDEDEQLLRSPRAPILLVPARSDAPPEDRLSRYVAPGCSRLGLFLPYTPLHELLFRFCPCRSLVMTSGNVSEEPIAHEDQDALERLGPLADLFLLHDRPIYIRCDDSVVQKCGGAFQVIRRSRGYVPDAVRLPADGPPVLAVGAELKNTVCLTRGSEAFLSEHIGDLVNPAASASFEKAIAHLRGLLGVEPAAVACDMHPDYLSARFARALGAKGLPVFEFQHHYAHIAATMAEHGMSGATIGVSMDGAGFGPDGTVWGGEILLCDLDGFRRIGRLTLRRMPGGDAASREPWRMAVSILDDIVRRSAWGTEVPGPEDLPALKRVEPEKVRAVRAMLERDVRCPRTSSAGRLFDAAAAMLGVCLYNRYEGQAPCMLQEAAELCLAGSIARPDDLAASPDGRAPIYGCPVVSIRTAGEAGEAEEAREVRGAGGPYAPELELDSGPMMLELARDAAAGRDPGAAALAFHRGLAAGIRDAVSILALRTGTDVVALGGGCFHNSLLLGLCSSLLAARGLKVLAPLGVPAGDGGIALGQAFLALAAIRRWKS
ncbi:MAG: carbamoyltransferase HypF [Planctomycetota bacterium]|nr:carbamoyltransferase HypF [Planctomycetota bacterium]